MSIAVVQTVGATGANVASVSTGAVSTTTGNLIHVDQVAYNGDPSLPGTFSDTAGNTFTGIDTVFHDATTSIDYQSKYVASATGNASNVYTLVLSGSGYCSFSITEISGQSASPLDLHERGSVGSTLSPSFTTTGTTAQANEIACAGISEDAIGFVVVTEASGWTNSFNDFSLEDTRLNTAHKVLSSTGTVTYNPTTAPSAPQTMWIVTYKAAGGSGETGTAALAVAGIRFSAAGRAEPIGSAALHFSGISFNGAGIATVTGTATLAFNGVSFSAAGRAEPIGSAVLAFGGVSFNGTGTPIVVGTGHLAFSGISLIGTGTDSTGSFGNLAFSGISFSASGIAKVTGAATLAFAGISIAGAGTDTAPVLGGRLHFAGVSFAATGVLTATGAGTLAFAGISILAGGFSGGAAGTGLRQFWTFQ